MLCVCFKKKKIAMLLQYGGQQRKPEPERPGIPFERRYEPA